MNPTQREQYLEAMGIMVWRQRQPGNAQPMAESPEAEAEVPAPQALIDAALDKAISEPTPAILTQAQEVATKAPNAAVASMEWPQLEASVKACTACGLCADRTQAVFGVGVQDADLLIVGEGPGAEEDKQGFPFVGPAGQLLDKMLAAINFARRPSAEQQGAYIANIVKCRPPQNRDPLPEEAAACRGYLERQVALVKPRLILAVGRVAAQNLLQTEAPLGRLRGTVHRHETSNTAVMVTYHPAYLLRSPGEKRKAWEDLKQARALLSGS
ncbi:MAG: uracil-DNA glycosylase [Nevskiales bacterium]